MMSRLGPAQHGDAAQIMLVAVRKLCQLLALQALGDAEIHHMLPVAKAEIVAHKRVVQHLGDVLSHFLFRMDHPVNPQPGQDAVMILGPGLGPDRADAHCLQVDRGKQTALDIGADGHKTHIAAVNARFAQHAVFARVEDQRAVQIIGERRDQLFIDVDTGHMVAKPREFAGDGAAEGAKPDHDKAAVLYRHNSLSKPDIMTQNETRRGKVSSSPCSFPRQSGGVICARALSRISAGRRPP
jgi:hypothetical protein